jgi:hypothetical protein
MCVRTQTGVPLASFETIAKIPRVRVRYCLPASVSDRGSPERLYVIHVG